MTDLFTLSIASAAMAKHFERERRPVYTGLWWTVCIVNLVLGCYKVLTEGFTQ